MRHFFTCCLLLCAAIASAQISYYVKFPNDLITSTCNAQQLYTEPQFFNPQGLALTFSYSDQFFYVVPDACHKIERTWIIKGPNYDPALPCVVVPNPNPNPTVNSPANLPGPVVSLSSNPNVVAAPWTATRIALSPGGGGQTDYAVFYNGGTYNYNGQSYTVPNVANVNCYEYKQIIKVLDTENPVVLGCPSDTLFFQDKSPNNPKLWNAPYWLDAQSQSTDLSEFTAELPILVTDDCPGGTLSGKYELHLDTDQNGTLETVLRSDSPPPPGTVSFNNYLNPNFTGGTSQVFDQRTTFAGEQYEFGVFSTLSPPPNPVRAFFVGWHTQTAPNDWVLPELPPGTHKIKWIVSDNCGNETVCTYFFTIGKTTVSTVHTLRGQVVADEDSNCAIGPAEPALVNWKIQLDRLDMTGGVVSTEYGYVGSDSFYTFQPGPGEYRVTALPPNANFQTCGPQTVTLSASGDTTQLDFPVKLPVKRAILETDISTPRLRRCFNNTYTVRYCNTGTALSDSAFVRIQLDPFQHFVSASQPVIFEGNGLWRMDLGQIPPGYCNTATLVAYLACATTVLGQTHCVEAHIYPDSFPVAPGTWSGASVKVDGVCQTDSVRFTLRNTGTASTALLEYRLIRDNTIVGKTPFQLLAGGTLRVSLPANGSTWRLSADQEPGHPGHPVASAYVEACGKNATGNVSLGFVPQFAESDSEPSVSLDCQQSVGSYDPNDKQGWPLGYGPEHLIEQGQPLDYLIRFQNTGTDTAFTVVVLDTLPLWLDPASVAPGASSHLYQFSLSGQGILSFRFENILLPDSNVNEAASHGFVKFRVKQRDAVPLGTAITNRAAIYFDFNAPVITNETQHQVGENFVPMDTAAQNDYYIRFPDDRYLTNCTPQAFAAEPQLFNTHGANITVEYTDENITVVPDACYRIDRTWTVKSADYDPALPCIQVPNPANASSFSMPNLLGPVVSPVGTPAPWTPTERKLLPSDPMPTNFSTYWSSTANCYQYKQFINVLDATDPAIACPSGPLFFADSTVNDSLLWNAPYWFDPFINSPNWSEAPVSLSIQASDACTTTDQLSLRALLFLDLDENGGMETVVDSRNLPVAGQVNFGNAQNPNFTGGTPRDFDQRPVAASEKYRFGIRKTLINNQIEATLAWNTEQNPNTWTQLQLPPGQHKIKWWVEDRCGNEEICEMIFQTGKAPTTALRTLRGKVFWDTNEDCQFGPNDFTPNDWQRIVLYTLDDDGKILSTTDALLGPGGTYQFLVKTGRYGLVPTISGNQFAMPCPIPGLWVTTVGDTSVHDFAMRPTTYCPVLQTDIGTAQLRPCEDNDYTVRYCNTGTVTATDAFVRVRLDRFLTLTSSSLSAVDEGNRYWRFAIGNLAPLECGSLRLTAHLDCDSILPGQTFCTEAHIYPDTACTKSGSGGGIPIYLFAGTMDLEGTCAADSVRFTLRNVHPTEEARRNWVLLEDDKIVRKATVDLLPGGSLGIAAPANGSTWRVQIDLPNNIPQISNKNFRNTVTVEACGRNSAGGISTGFVSQLWEADHDNFVSVDCQQTNDHYLPIDKHGYPLGYGTEHLIERGQLLDYIIRFQNLGTDTVRRVVVTDTLDPWLSGGIAQSGGSSHPYTFQRLNGNAIQFVFDNIQLPSWSVNEPASHGFVKFRVKQLTVSEPPLGAPIGEIIKNRASVRFDAEPPIMTPTTRHKIGQNFVKTSISSTSEAVEVAELSVSPNPAPNGAVLRFANLPSPGDLPAGASAKEGRFDLYDAQGRFVMSRLVQSGQVELGQAVLPSGMYFFKIFEGRKMRGAGKLGVQ